MRHLKVRRFHPSEKKLVKDLYELASIHSEIGYRSGSWESDFDDIIGVYVNPGGDFLLGEVNGEIVAMVGLLRKSDDVAYIRRMRVHPDHRRNGYAGKILKELELIANKNGIKELQLKTSTLQKMAQAFYEKNGYKKMDVKKSYYEEGPFESLWYRKKLE